MNWQQTKLTRKSALKFDISNNCQSDSIVVAQGSSKSHETFGIMGFARISLFLFEIGKMLFFYSINLEIALKKKRIFHDLHKYSYPHKITYQMIFFNQFISLFKFVIVFVNV